MISTEEANFLMSSYGETEDTHTKARIQAKLSEYKAAREAAKEPLWEPTVAEQRQKSEQLESYFDDTQNLYTPDNQGEELKAFMEKAPDPDNQAKQIANVMFLASEYGIDQAKANDDYELLKADYATKSLGLSGDVGDDALYSGIRGKVEERRGQRQWLTDFLTLAQKDAIDGTKTSMQSFAESYRGMSEVDGFDGKLRDYYAKAYKETYEQVAKQFDPVREQAMELFDFLGEKKGLEGVVSEENLPEMLRRLDASTPEERQMMYFLMQNKAEAMGLDKGFWKQTAESLGRGVADVAGGHLRNMNESRFNAAVRMTESDRPLWVPVSGKPGRGSTEELANWLVGNWRATDSGGIGGGGPDLRPASDFERTLINQQAKRWQKRSDIQREMRQVADGVIDPIKGSNFVTDKIWYPFTKNAAFTAQAFMGPLAMPLLVSSTTDMRFEEVMARNPGIDRVKAFEMAQVSGVVEAPIEMLSARLLIGKAPTFGNLLTKNATGMSAIGTQALKYLAVQGIEQNVQENLQDFMPILIQKVGAALDEDIPDLHIGAELKKQAYNSIDTFWATLPMVLIGTGGATYRDFESGQKYLENQISLKLMGLSDEKVAAILEETDFDRKQELYREAYAERDQALSDDALNALDAERAEIEYFLDSPLTPFIKQVGDVYKLEDVDGTLLGEANSFEQASEMAVDWMEQERTKTDSETFDMIDYIETIQDEGSSIQMLDDVSKTLQTKIDAGEIPLEDALEAIRIAGMNLGTDLSNATPSQMRIFGENVANFKDNVFKDVSRIFRGATPMDVIEEHSEGYLKRITATGEASWDDVVKWKQAYEEVSGKVTHDNSDRGLIEWFSSSSVDYVVGRNREFVKSGKLPSTFRSWLARLGEYTKVVMRQAASMMKLRRDGKLDADFESHLKRALGLDDAYLEARERSAELDQVREDLGLNDPTNELLEHVKRLGGLITSKQDKVLMGEIDAIKESTANKGEFLKLFRKKGMKLDDLRQALNEEGFQFETPAEVLEAVRDSLSGRQSFPVFDGERGLREDSFSMRPMFPESNRLSNIDRSGPAWNRIVKENPVMKSDPTSVVVYRATVGDAIRPNDFVALNKSIAEGHLENLADRNEKGSVVKQEVNADDLLMGNDATEFVYYPPPPTFASRPSDRVIAKFKLRRVTERIALAEHKGESFGAEVRKRAEGKMYEVMPNKRTVNEAKQILLKGPEEATKMFYNDQSGLSPRVRATLGMGLAEIYNSVLDYDSASNIADRLAEIGTELGQGVQVFSLLGAVLDSPEAAQAYYFKQVKKAKKEVLNRPEIEKATATVADVMKEAQKLLNGWIVEILGKPKKTEDLPRVENFPDVTFSLKPSLRPIIAPAAEMLEKYGTEALEKALIERYGDKVLPHLADIKIEAVKSVLKKRAKKPVKVDAPAAVTPEGVKIPKPKKPKAPTDPKEIKRVIREKLKKTAYEKLRERNIDTPEKIRNAVDKLIDGWDGGEITMNEIERAFSEKFKLPAANAEISGKLAEMAQKIARAPVNSVTRRNATVELMDFVHDELKDIDAIDVAWSVWYANILSGYNTHLRNLGDTGLQVVADSLLDTLQFSFAETIENIVASFRGGQKGAALGIRELARHVRTGEEIIGKETVSKFGARSVLERMPTYAGGKLNPANYAKYLKIVGRLLVSEDAFWFHTAQEIKARQVALEMVRNRGDSKDVWKDVDTLLGQTEEQIGNFQLRAEMEWEKFLTGDVNESREKWIERRVKELQIQSRDGDLLERASDFAARATYNYKPEGVLGGLVQSLAIGLHGIQESKLIDDGGFRGKSLKAVSGTGRFILPFTSIVANVSNKSLDYSPVGLLRAYWDVNLSLKGGKIVAEAKTADQRARELKKGILGTSMIIALMLRDPNDEDNWFNIHGEGPESYDKQNQLRGTGWMPYSVQIGDRFFSFRNTPFVFTFGWIGKIQDARRYQPGLLETKEFQERMAYALTGGLKTLKDQSFLTSMADMFEIMGRNDEAAQRGLERFFRRTFSPTAAIPFSNLLKQLSDDLDPYLRDKTGIQAELMSMVPWLSRDGKPSLNMLGDPIDDLPFNWLFGKEAEGDDARIWRMMAEKNAFLTGIYTYKNRLEAEDYYEFQKERGIAAKAMIKKYLPNLEAADSEAAKNLMERISKQATVIAKRKIDFASKDKSKEENQ